MCDFLLKLTCITIKNVRIMFNARIRLILFLYVLLFLPVNSVKNVLENVQPHIRELYDYRTVNWCITGRDEPELHKWPFNQFIPLLRHSHRYVHDDKNFRYDLRFYEIQTEQADVGRKGAVFKTVHVTFKAEARRDPQKGVKNIWEPLPLEGLIIQANHNPGTVGLPTGKFLDVSELDREITCMDCIPTFWAMTIPCRKRSNFAIEHPTVLAFHNLMQSFNSTDDVAGTQSEIHANFRWYSPPCTETRRFKFLIMAVRSFKKNEFDVFTKGVYEVIIRDQNYQSDNFPSPLFDYFTKESLCHVKSSTDIMTEHPRKYHDFEMFSKFDCCVRNEENPKSEDTLDQIKQAKSFSCKAVKDQKEEKDKDFNQIPKGKESYMCHYPEPIKAPCDTTTVERADLIYIPCPVCPTPPTSTTPFPITISNSIYKRTAHGGIMIMTNFCLQPIVIYIARFYKETFNLKSFKGVKMWYWMHLAGGMLSSCMIYFGYFSGAVTQRGYSHVVIGNVYIMTLAFCYLTSWGRHKNTLINLCAEFFHGCLGYVTISLALACVVTAPDVGLVSKLLVYSMVGTQCVFMMIMTCHICIMDMKFGMRPRRRHFPTVEARFDELEVPEGKFRMIMLLILSSSTFSLSFASTFFD